MDKRQEMMPYFTKEDIGMAISTRKMLKSLLSGKLKLRLAK